MGSRSPATGPIEALRTGTDGNMLVLRSTCHLAPYHPHQKLPKMTHRDTVRTGVTVGQIVSVEKDPERDTCDAVDTI